LFKHGNSVKEAESIISGLLKNTSNYSHVLWLPEEGKHMRIVKYVALRLWSLMEEREIFQNTLNQTNIPNYQNCQKQIGRLQTLWHQLRA
jgi:hypothetical protein